MNEKRIQEINLLLIWLTGWEEDYRNNPGEKVFRAWKGYLITTLNELEKKGLVHQIPNAKSLILTDAGIAEAKRLASKYES